MDKEGRHERIAKGKQVATQEGHGTPGPDDNMTGLSNSNGHPGAPSMDDEYGGPSNENDPRNFATAHQVQAWDEMVQVLQVMYGPTEDTVEEGFAPFLIDLENMTEDESTDEDDIPEDDTLKDDPLEDADQEGENAPTGSPLTTPSAPGPESPPVNCPVL